MKNIIPDIEWFSVVIEVKARYVLNIPAGDQREAELTAYNSSIPASKLYDIEKDIIKIGRIDEWLRNYHPETSK